MAADETLQRLTVRLQPRGMVVTVYAVVPLFTHRHHPVVYGFVLPYHYYGIN